MSRLATYAALLAVGVLALVAGSLAFASNDDNGNKTTFKADALIGYQEVVGPPSGPVSTAGHGSFEADLDGDVIHYTLTYGDLEGGTVTQAHIHFGQRAVSGGIIAFLCGGPKPACPASGTVTGDITAADVIGPATQGIEAGSFEEAVRALRVGDVYANVHTARWPAGEIRGQVNDSDQRQPTR
jgi:hypothetical protein